MGIIMLKIANNQKFIQGGNSPRNKRGTVKRNHGGSICKDFPDMPTNLTTSYYLESETFPDQNFPAKTGQIDSFIHLVRVYFPNEKTNSRRVSGRIKALTSFNLE
jgi:hypothetical protein